MEALLFFVIATCIILLIMFMNTQSCQKASPTKLGVYCVGKNYLRYTAAKDLATKLGARLATPKEVLEACRSNCNWNVLGWCKGLYAFTCKDGVPEGGKMPGQLKLGAYMYGKVPSPAIVRALLIH